MRNWTSEPNFLRNVANEKINVSFNPFNRSTCSFMYIVWLTDWYLFDKNQHTYTYYIRQYKSTIINVRITLFIQMLKLCYIKMWMTAVARKGPLQNLNAPVFELKEIQKWCWYRFVKNRRYWTELIDENKSPLVICINQHVQNFEIFFCHSYHILIYIFKKMNVSSYQNLFICENQPTMSSVITV